MRQPAGPIEIWESKPLLSPKLLSPSKCQWNIPGNGQGCHSRLQETTKRRCRTPLILHFHKGCTTAPKRTTGSSCQIQVVGVVQLVLPFRTDLYFEVDSNAENRGSCHPSSRTQKTTIPVIIGKRMKMHWILLLANLQKRAAPDHT